MVDIEKKKQRVCCACKKQRKIVNVGGPPLCKDCYPLACNWSKAYEKHQNFMMSLAGIEPLVIDTGRDDDFSYFLQETAKYIAEVKMKVKQTEICIINVCTMLRSEHDKTHKFDTKKLPKEQTTIDLPHWIVNGICMKKDDVICNLGYACDGCPYNKEKP